MKRTFALLSGLALLVAAAVGPARAATSAPGDLPLETVRTIQANAEAARDNAAIYQWRRVNLEVERILAAEHSLERTLPNNPAPAPAGALRQAVLDLRAARFAHDTDRTQAAAQRVADRCALLLR